MKIKTRDLVLIALFAALTIVGAWIRIPLPFTEVPITFQVLFVLLAGAMLGALRGALSQIVYLLLGAFGLPVFAGGAAGPGVLIGPTGGYIFGFVVAAFIVGLLVDLRKEPGIFWIFATTIVGVIAIYTLGMLQLALVAKLSLRQAFLVGVAPFILIDLAKGAVATGVAKAVRDTGVISK